MQSYEMLALKEDIKIVAYASGYSEDHFRNIKLPIKVLPSADGISRCIHPKFGTLVYLLSEKIGYNNHLFGLVDEIRDKDIAHTVETYWAFSYQAIKTKKKYGTKIVVTQWENIPFNFENNRIRRKIKNDVRSNADLFIAVTEKARDALIIEGVSEEKIEVIPPGINLYKFKPGEKNKKILRNLGLSIDDKIILFIGRLKREKGVYDLVYAAKRILDDQAIRENIHFIFVGSGEEGKNLHFMVKKLDIEKNVKFISYFPYKDINSLYNTADIFVLPSIPIPVWQEQLGMVLLEAMASGKPIISTMSGSIPEVIGDAGVLVQPNDPRGLYYSIKYLIQSEERREELSNKARERAQRNFDASIFAKKMKNAYKDVLER